MLSMIMVYYVIDSIQTILIVILLYTDDNILLSESEELLNVHPFYCNEWMLAKFLYIPNGDQPQYIYSMATIWK